jgi:TubC N-terminal docking domain
MSPAIEILSELAARGVTVRAVGDALKLRPAEALDLDMLERVRTYKPEILTALRRVKGQPLAACGSPNCAGCYDVGQGRRLHPPKPSENWLEWLARWQPKSGSVQQKPHRRNYAESV